MNWKWTTIYLKLNLKLIKNELGINLKLTKS